MALDDPAGERKRMPAVIRPMNPGEHDFCDRTLRSLPDWFGIEQAIVDYVRDLQTMETWIAEVAATPVGFVTIHQHNEHAAEIHVMAVVESFHRQGVGRQLVEHAERGLRSRSVEFLQVKTLAPSHSDPFYARTREFYRHLGFKPLEENRLWGDANPCLIMVKQLRCS